MTGVQSLAEASENQNVVFKDLNADDDDQVPMEIESYCVNCGDNVSILNIISMKCKLRIKINFYEILIKPTYASVIMMLFVLTSYNILYKNTTSNGISCLISIFLGMIIYMSLIIIFKMFNMEEIKNRIRKR